VIPYGGSTSFVDEFLLQLALTAVEAAKAAVLGLLNSFGSSTEPDFGSIAQVYDRMLAIALLLVGVFIACALIEKILGGPMGAGWAVIPRTLLCVFCAFAGLDVVRYLAANAALVATAWSPDLQAIAGQLGAVAHAHVAVTQGRGIPLGSVISLILIALLMDFMAIVVFLELVVRAALTLIVTAFIPIVCAMAIWPRMAGAITHLTEFLVGLLLSKFVIATVAYIGFGLVVRGLAGANSPNGEEDWIVTGVAILCIAAFSPIVLVQGLRFTHSSASTVARGWIGGTVGLSQAALGAATLGTRAVGGVTSGIARGAKGLRAAKPQKGR
jgi:hypothetical protein